MYITQNNRFVPQILWFICVLVCGWIIVNTDYRTDLSVFLPSEPNKKEVMLLGQLQNGAANRILLVGIEGSDTATLAQIGKSFAAKVRSNPVFSHVLNDQNVIDPVEQKLIYTYRYLLSPNTNVDLFTPETLETVISTNLLELSSASGLLSKSLFMRDPTGEVMALVDRLTPVQGPQTINGQWFNDRGDRALLLVQLASTGTDTKAQEAALWLMQASFKEVVQSFQTQSRENAQKTENIGIVISGPASFAVATQNIIKEEASRLSAIGLILIVTILFYVLRNLKLLFVGLLPVFSGVVAGIATVSLGFGSVHAMTIGFGITLIGESIDYSIYFFLQRSQTAECAGNNPMFWRTVGLGVMTSICGFSTLLFSGFTGLMQLAAFSIAGLLVAVLCTRWILPTLLPQRLSIHDLSPVGVWLRLMMKKGDHFRYFIWFLTVGALLLLLSRQDYLWSYELNDLSPIPAALLDLDGELRADMGAADVRHMLLLQDKTEEQVLQRCEQFLPRLDALVAKGLLGGYQAPCTYLPSQAKQIQRQQVLPDQERLEQAIQEATHTLPLSVQSFQGFVEDVSNSKALPLLRSDKLESSTFGITLSVTLYPVKVGGNRFYHALIQLQAPLQNGKVGSINHEALQTELLDILNEQSVLLDLKDDFNSIYKTYLNKVLKYSAAGFIAIIVLLLLVLRSLQTTFLVILPLACAILFVTALLHLLGFQLNLLNIIGLLLVFAVGSNYALFFSSSQSNMTLASLLLATTTTGIGYGVLIFSQIPILQTIGITVASGVFFALIFSALMAPQSFRKNSGSISQS
ncbi:MAG: MMPL family transporter [Nitrosomonas sp.]|nr:MMPL family transporter [Nitrosomonas sp.]